MPPTTASSFFSLPSKREVTSKRFITLVLRVVFIASSLVKRLAAGQERREDQRHRRLRGKSLLERAIDDEFELVEPCRGVVFHRKRVEHRPHGAADQRLAEVEFAERTAL